MTRMLASVATPGEALLAERGGADVIDLKDPLRGALGAVGPETVRATLAALGGRRRTSAVTGDLPMSPDAVGAAARGMADAGVDDVKVGIFPGGDAAGCIRALAPLAARASLVAVLFADAGPDLSLLPLLAECGFAGAMLDTSGKQAGRLLTHMPLAALGRFVEACRRHGLVSGLAGSLEAPDVPRLLVLGPGLLGFRGALCEGAVRTAALSPAAIARIRALIPAEGDAVALGDLRVLSARGYAPATQDANSADRVFVRDLVLPMQVGAYAFEHGHTQRVRFDVEASVVRPAWLTADLADVFSYDVITDGIRLLIEEHIDLLETLAERIAAMLLAHPAVLRVRVRLEKLDVGEGVVGCAIERVRAA